jgi:hypothetical protein
MPEVKAYLEVVDVKETREVRPFGAGAGLAIGRSTAELVVRAPSGRHWIVQVPPDMVFDLFPSDPGFDERNNVVAPRDKDLAPPI